MIEIVVSLKILHSKDYVKAFAVMYLSIRAFTSHNLTVHIIHDHTLTREDIECLSSIALAGDIFRFVDVTKSEIYPQIIRFTENATTGCFTDAVLWRIFLPEILPDVERLIICDVDLIFQMDISKIWETELSEHECLASVIRKVPHRMEYLEAINTKPNKYFRMGLTLIDMVGLKRHRLFMEERTSFLFNKLPKINEIEPLNEQSLFNNFFSEHCHPLDVNRTGNPDKVDFAKNNNVLDIKGWRFDTPLAYLYFFFLLQTPWKDEAIARFKHARIGFALSNRSTLLRNFFETIVKVP